MKTGMYRWMRYPFIAVMVLAFALLAAACGDDEDEKPTIRFADNQYESLFINDAIAQFIIEEGYGYPTEIVPVTTQIAQVTLATGDTDIWMELWYEYYPDWADGESAAGNIIQLNDVLMFDGPGFWFINKSIAEEHNIKTVEDMKRPEVMAAFQDPEDSSKGLFLNCAIGTQCSKINPSKLRGYGLDEFYNTLEPGTQGAHDASIAGAMLKGEPVFSYYWAPTWLIGTYGDDLTILEEPAYTDACWDEITIGKDDTSYPLTEACAYKTSKVTKVINAGLPDKAPDVVEFLRKMSTGGDELSRTSAWAVENEVTDWSKAGVYYLRNFEDRWTTWLPADVATKVKAALAEAS